MKRFLHKRIDTQSNNVLRSFKILTMSLMILVTFTSQLYAAPNVSITQQKEIKGTVTGADKTPLPGVNIQIVGTTNGTQTDFDGNYTIKANTGDVLQFTFIGMETKTVTVGDNTTINVIMQESANALDEVVVVGYGTQTRAKVTGAVSTINAEDLISLPTTTAEQALQGRASGVTLINGGSPGSAPVVRIRGVGTYGNNTPVFVVDGVLTDNIADLNADDIESISVLKDASTTAVYGSLGANGVIVVSTKKGKKGKVKFNFNTYVGTQFAPENLDVLNSQQYVDYVTDLTQNAGAGPPARFSDPGFAQLLNTNTNWQDAVFQSGTIESYNLSASGGNESSSFRLSGGYLTQDGIIISTGLEKYTFRMNSKFKTGKFKFGENFSLAFTNQQPLINANNLSPLENAIRSAPYLSIFDSNGGFGGVTVADGNTARNPVRTLTAEKDNNTFTDIIGNIYGSFDVFDGLTYKVNVGISHSDKRFKIVRLPFQEAGNDGLNGQPNTQIRIINTTNNNITLSNSLKYTKTFAEKHNFEVLLLSEKETRKLDLVSASGSNDLGNEQIINNDPNNNVSSIFIPYTRIGYLGRLNYDYKGKYIFAYSFRRDASSRFGPNNRWGNFNSLAGGWVVSKEDFFNQDGVMNYLKLRGSWGQAGNDKIGNFLFNPTLSFNFPLINDPGIAFASLGNPDIKWEETTITNIGVDFGFFNNKLTFSAEYYNNESDDLLVSVPAAASVGNTAPTVINIGAMTTDGFEFNLGYKHNEGDFKWSANFNLSTSDNEITKLAPNVTELFVGSKPNVLDDGPISRLTEGESLWHFYGWKTDGIFQTQAEADASGQANAAPGDIRFKDLNGDGTINADDRTVIGNPLPDINYGLSFDAQYKNFDVNFLFSGVAGNEIFNALRFYLDGADGISNAGPAVLNRWTPTNPSNSQPRAVSGDPNTNTRVSDRYVEDGSYFRLRTLSLGYSLDQKMLSSFANGALSKLRFYISGQNLFTITSYSGYDPELSPATGAVSLDPGANVNNEVGIDRGQYPQAISLLAGLQISF